MSGRIIVVGLGAGDLAQLSLGVYQKLTKAKKLYLRTADHPVVADLKREGLDFETFDQVYESLDTFDAVYKTIVERLFAEAGATEVVYAVPGHPMVAEKTVQWLLDLSDERGVPVEVSGGQSFLDPLFTALGIDPIEGFVFYDALDLNADDLPLDRHLVVCQVYDPIIASEVKLALLEQLPPDYEVFVVTSVGNQDESIVSMPLEDLDRKATVNNLTSVYVPPVKDKNLLNHTFIRLRRVIRQLRGPDGCPWDREQTHESLKKYLIEEANEVIEAIEEQDDDHLIEELGDVLLQVMLHAQIGEDEGFFNIQDVIRALTEKMIRRHPHVFGSASAASPADVERLWNDIKLKEKDERRD
ncbi:MazG family protein [Camelliibacillus cellulosilyticus]|uniref:MazG family protein n=1 Tax=Camelliibacillus cellulosilyticus TaxID=2174486 RepID=A0ABV9GSX9_9BACL